MLPTVSAVTCVLCHATVSVRRGSKERFLSHVNQEHEVHHDRDLIYALSFMTEQEKQTLINVMEKRMGGEVEERESAILDTSTDSAEVETSVSPEENVAKTELPVKTERKQSSRSQCPQCEVMVPKKSLKIHLKMKCGLVQSTTCQFCDKIMRKDSLIRHLKQVHGSSKKDHENLTSGRRPGEPTTKIKTEVMEEVTAGVGGFDNPTPSQVERKKQRKCKICFKNVMVTRYSRHLKEKHSGIMHKCKLCHVRLVRKEYVKKHMESVHRNDIHLLDAQLNPTFSRSDCKFDCPECSIKLISAELRDFHVAKSHGIGAEQCGNCERRFKTKERLRKHQGSCTVLSVSMP